jgi:hypothetical protein
MPETFRWAPSLGKLNLLDASKAVEQTQEMQFAVAD